MTIALILANNEPPKDCFRPERVYSISCSTDDAALASCLENYDAKLAATVKILQKRVQDIRAHESEPLSDQEAAEIFRFKATIPVAYDDRFQRDSLFVNHKRLGLAFDCPCSEANAWNEEKNTALKAVAHFTKEPKKGLRKATEYMRVMTYAPVENANALDTYQMNDFIEYVNAEEMQMVLTCPPDIHDQSRFQETCDVIERKIKDEQETRMTKKTTITLGVAAVAAYLIGFLPFIFSEFNTAGSAALSLWYAAAAIALIVASGFVCLLFLRRRMVKLWNKFNAISLDIATTVDLSMRQFSEYLGHVCNMMRGYSIINYREGMMDPNNATCAVLEKHIGDIMCIREHLAQVFESLPVKRKPIDPDGIDGYEYAFDKLVDYAYPFPQNDRGFATIEYLQSGNCIGLPLAFVKAVTLEREELYD